MRAHITDDSPRLARAAGIVTLAVVLAIFGLAGCGPKNKNVTPSTTTTGSTGAQFEVGNTLNYGSFGTTADLDCADGKSLNVGGSNNTLTVKGTCSSVSVGGADNKITFDKIGQHLSVVGLNNTITYKNGDPKVDNLGSGNTINKG
ncbi:MAG TPA: DUF3060 domain-containing protein [Mycobacterium sp.]|nr:DUF3060 domain-containing protein [Mycobacterium sp.]